MLINLFFILFFLSFIKLSRRLTPDSNITQKYRLRNKQKSISDKIFIIDANLIEFLQFI